MEARQLTKGDRILSVRYTANPTFKLSAKMRKMSKRRQKIALQRQLFRELQKFVGTPWNGLARDDVVDACGNVIRRMLQPVVIDVKCCVNEAN